MLVVVVRARLPAAALPWRHGRSARRRSVPGSRRWRTGLVGVARPDPVSSTTAPPTSSSRCSSRSARRPCWSRRTSRCGPPSRWRRCRTPTRTGCGCCWPGRGSATRSATSRCAATRRRCSRRRGKAAVSYRVVSGVMLASGDPIGDPEAWPGAIAEFVALARRHAWVPAVMGCSEQGGEVWVREAELRALELGDEAVRRHRRVHPRRAGDAQRPADGGAGRAGRLHDRGTPGRRHDARRRSPTSAGRPPPGAVPRSSAGSRWRSAGSATRATPTASP